MLAATPATTLQVRDQASVQVLAGPDGKFVAHTNDGALSPADLALG